MPELPFNQLLTRCRRRPRSAAGTARFFVCKTCKEIKMYPNQEEKKKVPYSLFVLVSFSATGRFHSDSPVRCGIETPLGPKHVQIIENAILLLFFFRRKNNLVRMRRRLLGAGMLGSAMTSHPRSCFKFSSLLRSS